MRAANAELSSEFIALKTYIKREENQWLHLLP